MYALTLNGNREFPLYSDKAAAKKLLTFLNHYGDGQGRKGYELCEVA